MNLSLFYLLTLALACDRTHPGYLYISKIDELVTHKYLKIFGGRLYVSSNPTFFHADHHGNLRLPEADSFLTVNDIGKLSTVEHDQVRSQFGFDRVAKDEYVLFVGMEDSFQLCGDGSIAFKSRCKAQHRLTINFVMDDPNR